MARTRIRQTDPTIVALTYVDPDDGRAHTREFWAPRSGGHVRELNPRQPGYAADPQVCERLSHRGNTLRVDDPATELLPLIRAEWARSLRQTKASLRRGGL